MQDTPSILHVSRSAQRTTERIVSLGDSPETRVDMNTRDNQTHSLRKFVIRRVLVGKCLRPSMQAICLELDNVTTARAVTGGHVTHTEEIIIDRRGVYSKQPAEYYSSNRSGAIAQFNRDMPKIQVIG